MKLSVLAPVLAVTGLCACRSDNPEYYSHWNPGSLGPRAEHTLIGNHVGKDSGYLEYAQDTTSDMVVTFQRHFLNHNPTNPYEMGYLDGEWPYTIWPLFGHTYAIAEQAVYGAVHGATVVVAQPVDAVVGTLVSTGADAVGMDYTGQSLGSGITPTFTGDDAPPPPSSFKVKKKK